MASHAAELLAAASTLLLREAGQRGRLPQARIRRSISTSYYALFSFVVEAATLRIVGSRHALRRRRRELARCFTHAGLKKTFAKTQGVNVDVSVVPFLDTAVRAVLPSPPFARAMARAFCDAQAKRHDADYDMNSSLSEVDARLLVQRARDAIDQWNLADGEADRDFKHALYLLMLLKGALRE